jgi:predicted DNA-binding transcriptional regulator AlpA
MIQLHANNQSRFGMQRSGVKTMQLVHESRPAVPRDRFIDIKSVCPLVGFEKSTVYAWVRDPGSDFPRPVKFGGRCVRWSESAVLQWVQNRINQSMGLQS